MATPIKKDPPEEEGLGILQALANVYNWRENLAENINPRGYDMSFDEYAPGYDDPILGNQPLQRLYNAVVLDRKEPQREKEEQLIQLAYDPEESDLSQRIYGTTKYTAAGEAERQDLLNLMLGQEQIHGSIEPAIYKPTKSKNPDAEYYRSKVTEAQIKNELMNPYVPVKLRGGGTKGYKRLHKSDEEGGYIGRGEDIVGLLLDKNIYGDSLGNFTLNKGVDDKGHYISYYDIWDVNPLSSGGTQGDEASIMPRGLDQAIQSAIGIKPAEVYGRIYYDPKTGLPIEEKEYGGTVRTLNKTYKQGGKIKLLKKKKKFISGGTMSPGEIMAAEGVTAATPKETRLEIDTSPGFLNFQERYAHMPGSEGGYSGKEYRELKKQKELDQPVDEDRWHYLKTVHDERTRATGTTALNVGAIVLGAYTGNTQLMTTGATNLGDYAMGEMEETQAGGQNPYTGEYLGSDPTGQEIDFWNELGAQLLPMTSAIGQGEGFGGETGAGVGAGVGSPIESDFTPPSGGADVNIGDTSYAKQGSRLRYMPRKYDYIKGNTFGKQ